jgi:hypothetical protein
MTFSVDTSTWNKVRIGLVMIPAGGVRLNYDYSASGQYSISPLNTAVNVKLPWQDILKLDCRLVGKSLFGTCR